MTDETIREELTDDEIISMPLRTLLEGALIMYKQVHPDVRCYVEVAELNANDEVAAHYSFRRGCDLVSLPKTTTPTRVGMYL